MKHLQRVASLRRVIGSKDPALDVSLSVLMDDDLRHLEHEARTAGEDAATWIRYVRALDRHGRPAPTDLEGEVTRIRAALADSEQHANIRVGDEVLVEEINSNNWIVGPWRGIVTKILLGKTDRGSGYLQFYVRPFFPDEDDPDAAPLPFRVKPLGEQRVNGLILAREDRLELVARRTE